MRVLIATVGKIINPLMISINYHQPDALLLIPSTETYDESLEDNMRQQKRYCEFDIILASEADDLLACFETGQEVLATLRLWTKRNPGNLHLIIEATFGTKMMTLGIALALAQEPNITWSYVTGKRDGAGAVMPTTETVKSFPNPLIPA